MAALKLVSGNSSIADERAGWRRIGGYVLHYVYTRRGMNYHIDAAKGCRPVGIVAEATYYDLFGPASGNPATFRLTAPRTLAAPLWR